MEVEELVRGENNRTHPEMSVNEEHDERLIGMIDARGRRLPSAMMLLGLFTIALAAAGICMRLVSHE